MITNLNFNYRIVITNLNFEDDLYLSLDHKFKDLIAILKDKIDLIYDIEFLELYDSEDILIPLELNE